MSDWRKVRVIVATGDPAIDAEGVCCAFSDGSQWNGWEVPFFTAEQGKRVADWTRLVADDSADPGAQDVVTWDSDTKTFILESNAYPDEPERDVIEGIFVEGLGETVYGIGGYRWTWEIASDDPD